MIRLIAVAFVLTVATSATAMPVTPQSAAALPFHLDAGFGDDDAMTTECMQHRFD
jgi:hypothetical protein